MTAPTCAVCAKPLADGSTACTACARSLAQALRDAAGHAEDAWTVIARQARYGTSGGARAEPELGELAEDRERNAVKEFAWAASIERPLAGALRPGVTPYDDSASRRLADVTNTVTTWARHVCEERGAELPARRPLLGPLCAASACEHGSCARIRWRVPPSDLGEAAAWLATQAGWLRMRPEAAEAFDELQDACTLLEQLVDRPREHLDRLVGMCDCGRILYAPHDREVVQCKPCGARWNVAESQEILLKHLDGQLLTAAEAARMAAYFDPGRTTEQIRMLIASWAKRGQVVVRGEIGGVPTYRFGEIRARLAETPRRQRDGAAA